MQVTESQLVDIISSTLKRHSTVNQQEQELVGRLEYELTDADISLENDLARIIDAHATRRAGIINLIATLNSRIGAFPNRKKCETSEDMPRFVTQGGSKS